MEPSFLSASACKVESDAAFETSSVFSAIGTSAVRNEDSATSFNRRPFEFLSEDSWRGEEYRCLFRLPSYEVLIRDYNCALQENILLEGHMYLFLHHICFYSNLFGFETKKIISFHEVKCVRKAKTAAIFPNAIEIVAGGKTHFFASFLSRDEAYQLIIDVWSQNGGRDKAICEYQESKSNTGNLENSLILAEASKCFKQSTDDFNYIDRIGKSTNNVSGPSSKDEDVSAESMKISKAQENERGENAQCSSQIALLTSKPEDANAPKIPECYTKVAESKFQIQVEEFFSFFFSNDAVEFAESFHGRCGDKDFKVSPWHQHEQSRHTRNMSFQHPIKAYLGLKFAHCHQVQKLHVYRNRHMIIETSQKVDGIPYGDHFHVEALWDVKQQGENGYCILQVYLHVAFSKKTVWKGIIEQSTIEECRETYTFWIKMAHELLDRRQKSQNMEKPKGKVDDLDTTNMMTANVDGLKYFTKIEEPSEEVDDGKIPFRNSDLATVPRDVITHLGKPVIQDLKNIKTSLVSLLTDMCKTVSSYLRSQCNFPMVLVIMFISVLVTMQISIIVLLLGPPKAHIVSPENILSSFDGGRDEAAAWLERRANYLTDQMLIVEDRLEKMRSEYMFLKTRLQDLEMLNAHS